MKNELKKNQMLNDFVLNDLFNHMKNTMEMSKEILYNFGKTLAAVMFVQTHGIKDIDVYMSSLNHTKDIETYMTYLLTEFNLTII